MPFVPLVSNIWHIQGPRNRGGRGGPGPPRIEDLESKIFENSQNVIFLIIRAPLDKICSSAPENTTQLFILHVLT